MFMLCYVDIIQGNDATVTCGETLNFYDSGGVAADCGGSSFYQNLEDTTTTICPNNGNGAVHVEFLDVDLEDNQNGDCWDYLRIYDGPSSASSLLLEGCGRDGFEICNSGTEGYGNDAGGVEGGPNDINGANTPNPANNVWTSSDASGCLTVHFQSDASVIYAGWVAQVSVVDCGM
jgi:hypothetical protein